MKKNVLPNGVVDWGMSSRKYVQSAVQNVQEYLVELPGDQKLQKKAYGPLAGGGTILSSMRVLRWTPSGRISISHRLGLCAGVWSCDALTSSLKCQYCLITFSCRIRATWKISSMCLHTGGYITTRELTPLLPWVPSSRLIGTICMVM
jgi:hypothetical protein